MSKEGLKFSGMLKKLPVDQGSGCGCLCIWGQRHTSGKRRLGWLQWPKSLGHDREGSILSAEGNHRRALGKGAITCIVLESPVR